MYVMQDMVVPCLADKEGNIALDPFNPFLIQVKPTLPSYLKVVWLEQLTNYIEIIEIT